MVKFNKILLLVFFGLNISAGACEDSIARAAIELPKSTTVAGVDKHYRDVLKRRRDKLALEASKQKLRDKLFTADGQCRCCDKQLGAGIIMRSCLTHYGCSRLVPSEQGVRMDKADHVEFIAPIKASGLHAEIFANYERYVLNQRGSSAMHKVRQKVLKTIEANQAIEANKRQRTASPELHE